MDGAAGPSGRPGALAVYAFDDAEETADVDGAPREPAVAGFSFLQSFFPGSQMSQPDVNGFACIGIDDEGIQEAYAAEPPGTNLASSNERTEYGAALSSSGQIDHDIDVSNGFQPAHAIAHIPSIGASNLLASMNGMVPDSEEGWTSCTQSSPGNGSDASGFPKEAPDHYAVLGNGYNAYMERMANEVATTFYPEYVMYGAALCLDPQLTFLSDCVKLEYSTSDACFDGENVAIEWELPRIIKIFCQWIKSVGVVVMRLLIQDISDNKEEGLEVRFQLTEARWPEAEMKIWSLSSRYKDIWSKFPLDTLVTEHHSSDSTMFFPRVYFTRILEEFDDVVYPNGDPDPVSLSKRDVDLLLPETFVNDTIIDFYIKFLSNQLPSDEKRRFHFFNSFFFRKLADLDKDPSKAPNSWAAFQRVKKWTRKVNLFEKDFIFVPVNFNLHWSLLVICYPGLATHEDDDLKESQKTPCILHMDSLKGSHAGLKDIIQSYLSEEWKAKHPGNDAEKSERFLNMRFVSLEVPQQDNSFDCGLFLLHYVELFLKDVPSCFNALSITEFSTYLTADWFPSYEASFKRSIIRKLIYALLDDSKKPLDSSMQIEDHRSYGHTEKGATNPVKCVDFLPSTSHCTGVLGVGSSCTAAACSDFDIKLEPHSQLDETVAAMPVDDFTPIDCGVKRTECGLEFQERNASIASLEQDPQDKLDEHYAQGASNQDGSDKQDEPEHATEGDDVASQPMDLEIDSLCLDQELCAALERENQVQPLLQLLDEDKICPQPEEQGVPENAAAPEVAAKEDEILRDDDGRQFASEDPTVKAPEEQNVDGNSEDGTAPHNLLPGNLADQLPPVPGIKDASVSTCMGDEIPGDDDGRQFMSEDASIKAPKEQNVEGNSEDCAVPSDPSPDNLDQLPSHPGDKDDSNRTCMEVNLEKENLTNLGGNHVTSAAVASAEVDLTTAVDEMENSTNLGGDYVSSAAIVSAEVDLMIADDGAPHMDPTGCSTAKMAHPDSTDQIGDPTPAGESVAVAVVEDEAKPLQMPHPQHYKRRKRTAAEVTSPTSERRVTRSFLKGS